MKDRRQDDGRRDAIGSDQNAAHRNDSERRKLDHHGQEKKNSTLKIMTLFSCPKKSSLWIVTGRKPRSVGTWKMNLTIAKSMRSSTSSTSNDQSCEDCLAGNIRIQMKTSSNFSSSVKKMTCGTASHTLLKRRSDDTCRFFDTIDVGRATVHHLSKSKSLTRAVKFRRLLFVFGATRTQPRMICATQPNVTP